MKIVYAVLALILMFSIFAHAQEDVEILTDGNDDYFLLEETEFWEQDLEWDFCID